MTRTWTTEQAAAIAAGDHTLLVANAGTGKTTTIVGKVLWLLGQDVGSDETGRPLPRCAAPCRLGEVAAITFTEKAAYDLKEKLREEIAKLPDAEPLLWELETAALGTIHSFCGQLLRENALRLGIDPTFGVLDEKDARLRHEDLLRQVIFERLSAGDEDVADLIRTYQLVGLGEYGTGTLDHARTAFRDMRWNADRYAGWADRDDLAVERVYGLFRADFDAADLPSMRRCAGLFRIARTAVERWRDIRATENFRDFDSLILDARALLKGPSAGAALAGIRRRCRILIIDEFQDTDRAQRDIAYAIAREVERPQLFLVGDPKQSIYRFRGADISVWNEVSDDLAAIQAPLTLRRNFRSDPAIIRFANAAAKAAIEETGAAVGLAGGARVSYSELEAARASLGTGCVTWHGQKNAKADAQRTQQGQRIVEEIRALVGRQLVVDPRTGTTRACTYRDIAVLYRSRTDLHLFQDPLRQSGIPFHETSPAGLAERQEVLDLLNLLRLLHNPHDDLRAFAYLRSPFVGLRDEVLARIRLDAPPLSYLAQARWWLDHGEAWAAPEHADVADIERSALSSGLHVFESASRLADRVPIDELLEHVLEESGYRAHLHLLDGSREAIAGIDSFLHAAAGFRDHSIGAFLELRDQREERDQDLPQAPLHSSGDDVVTFSTVHAAKGLEWPVVFLIDVGTGFRERSTNQYWTDPKLGPILCPKMDERGPRATELAARFQAESLAEEARLLYVALTRARDRLVLLGEVKERNSYSAWLLQGANATSLAPDDTPPAEIRAEAQPRVSLDWIDRIEPGAAELAAMPLPEPPHRWMTSATELMAYERDVSSWKLQYIHGVEPSWVFAPRGTGKVIPERIRGDIIHGVLERIREDAQLSQILEETIGELETPELEFALAPGSRYRDELEAEITRVIRSADWAWYIEHEHHRELPFLHLAAPREWRMGAFDLYRPDGWIIDFKTHQVTAESVDRIAASYRLQMRIYGAAAAIRGAVRTRLHFTHPGVVIDVE